MAPSTGRKGGGLLAALVLCAVQGCTSAQAVANFHTLASDAMTVLHAAKTDPTLLPKVKTLLVAAIAQASPADADKLQTALGHVNQGQVDSLDNAIQLVAPTALAGVGQ